MTGNERSALDVCTPPLTPTSNNGKPENGINSGADGDGGDEIVEYTLKPTTRAYASTARLNLQHYLWKDQTGFLLHPSISLDGRTDLKIADVGTGTGIWLLDLARTLPPTTQLDGFDIDISDCPPKQWLPPNVSMRFLDALGDVPEELVGVYDVVQLRLFQVVVKDGDPGMLLRNVVSMLKPGGYIQWAEYDMTTQKTIKASPDLSSSALDAIPAFVQGLKKKDERVGVQNWIPHLPTLFRTHNLHQIASSRHPTAPPSLPAQLDIFLLTYEELAAKTLDSLPGNDGYGDRLRELIEGGSREGRKGVAWAMDRFVVVGRKRGGVEVGGDVGEGCIIENGEGSVPVPVPVPVVEPNAAALPANVETSETVVAERVHVREKTKKRSRRWEGWVRLWKRLSVR